jgi:NADPH2:quinone reductase
MRAVVITDTSNRSVSIADVADPTPGDDEILVDVKACGVNFTDLLSLDGKYQNNPPPPFTPGKDASGIVAAVGANVTNYKVGDRLKRRCVRQHWRFHCPTAWNSMPPPRWALPI